MNVRNQADDLSDHSHGAPPRLKLGPSAVINSARLLLSPASCTAARRSSLKPSPMKFVGGLRSTRWPTLDFWWKVTALTGPRPPLAAAHPRGGARHRCRRLGAQTGGGHLEPVQPVEALGEVGCRSPTPPMKYLSDFTTSTCEAPYTTHAPCGRYSRRTDAAALSRSPPWSDISGPVGGLPTAPRRARSTVSQGPCRKSPVSTEST